MKIRFLGLTMLALVTLGYASSVTLGGQRRQTNGIKLNPVGLEYAKVLIAQGQVIADGKGAWTARQPSAAGENQFIRENGFAEYAKWHLGIDDSHAQNTKARYKFPYGDFTSVHRSALMAAKSRAHQYGYLEIENAAEQLLKIIQPQKKR
jgi:hypothetical protein